MTKLKFSPKLLLTDTSSEIILEFNSTNFTLSCQPSNHLFTYYSTLNITE